MKKTLINLALAGSLFAGLVLTQSGCVSSSYNKSCYSPLIYQRKQNAFDRFMNNIGYDVFQNMAVSVGAGLIPSER
jgi:hypothetical protein